jgi:hypothetical protein
MLEINGGQRCAPDLVARIAIARLEIGLDMLQQHGFSSPWPRILKPLRVAAVNLSAGEP